MWEVIPPKLKIDDLIVFFGYENNVRGYTFIFDMINHYGLPVYIPMPAKFLHLGNYEMIPQLKDFFLVKCQIKRCFFMEQYYKKKIDGLPRYDFLRIDEVIVSGNVLKCFKVDEKDNIEDFVRFNYEFCYAKGLEVLQFKKRLIDKQMLPAEENNQRRKKQSNLQRVNESRKLPDDVLNQTINKFREVKKANPSWRIMVIRDEVGEYFGISGSGVKKRLDTAIARELISQSDLNALLKK